MLCVQIAYVHVSRMNIVVPRMLRWVFLSPLQLVYKFTTSSAFLHKPLKTADKWTSTSYQDPFKRAWLCAAPSMHTACPYTWHQRRGGVGSLPLWVQDQGLAASWWSVSLFLGSASPRSRRTLQVTSAWSYGRIFDLHFSSPPSVCRRSQVRIFFQSKVLPRRLCIFSHAFFSSSGSGSAGAGPVGCCAAEGGRQKLLCVGGSWSPLLDVIRQRCELMDGLMETDAAVRNRSVYIPFPHTHFLREACVIPA